MGNVYFHSNLKKDSHSRIRTNRQKKWSSLLGGYPAEPGTGNTGPTIEPFRPRPLAHEWASFADKVELGK